MSGVDQPSLSGQCDVVLIKEQCNHQYLLKLQITILANDTYQL